MSHVGQLLLTLAPALALALLVLARRFPGERALVAIARRRRQRRARRPARGRAPAAARRPRGSTPRGTALIAQALAKRPPPPAPLAT